MLKIGKNKGRWPLFAQLQAGQYQFWRLGPFILWSPLILIYNIRWLKLCCLLSAILPVTGLLDFYRICL